MIFLRAKELTANILKISNLQPSVRRKQMRQCLKMYFAKIDISSLRDFVNIVLFCYRYFVPAGQLFKRISQRTPRSSFQNHKDLMSDDSCDERARESMSDNDKIVEALPL